MTSQAALERTDKIVFLQNSTQLYLLLQKGTVTMAPVMIMELFSMLFTLEEMMTLLQICQINKWYPAYLNALKGNLNIPRRWNLEIFSD